jgi:integrase
MPTPTPQKQLLAALTRVRRVNGRPGDPYQVIFVDRNNRTIVPLTEWYRLRKDRGSAGTRNTYLTHLFPYFSFLEEQKCPWNASPERLRSVFIAFHRDKLGCLIRSGKDRDHVEVVPTRGTPVRDSTLGVLRAALRDLYGVLRDAGLYAFPNPLTSDVLVALKRELVHAVANSGAPDHAGIRAETQEQSRRRPTAFLRHPEAHGWKPDLRKELADMRAGMHQVLDALIDSTEVSLREKAVLQLLRTTGARLHEVVLMTVGGYRHAGIAGQADVVNKGSYGRESKVLYFAHNPQVERALTVYLEQLRPLYDSLGRTRLTDVSDQEPLFLSERGTPYSTKSFYYHWYKHYSPLRSRCPVRFSPHDIRHLFITEYLIRLKLACGAGTAHFDSEHYLHAREAFASTIMGWRSAKTIDIYDHSRDGEAALSVLADYQRDLAERHYLSEHFVSSDDLSASHVAAPWLPTDESRVVQSGEIVWLHDVETLDWIKKLQQQDR